MAETGRACGTNWREKNHVQGNLKKICHLEHLGLNWSIILKWISKRNRVGGRGLNLWFRIGLSGRLL